MSRNDGGIGKADPWPTNDEPIHEQNPSPHQSDGYYNRAPGGGHYEAGSDYWLDCMVYPDRPNKATGYENDRADFEDRMFRVNLNTVLGRKPGPCPD